MLESEITLFISLLPAATPLRLSLYLAFIFASPSPVCFHTSPPSHRVWLFSPPLFLILRCSWESTGVREGLKHQGKRGWYCILTRLVLFSPSISLLCEAMRDFFFLRLHPPRLTLPPYLPVIMWCRWEVAAAEQVALFLPIPPFFWGGGGFAHLLTLLCTTKVNYNSIRERERKSVGWGDSGGGRYLWRTLVAAQGQERSNNLILRVKLWLGLASVRLQKSFPSYWSSGFPPAREAHAPSNLCNYTGMYDSRFEKQSSRSYFQTFKWKSNHC